MDNMRLDIGGKEITLKPLKLNDGISLEEKLGSTFLSGDKTMSLKELAYFVYVILHRADSEITEDWVGENVDLNNGEQLKVITNFFTADSSQKK